MCILPVNLDKNFKFAQLFYARDRGELSLDFLSLSSGVASSVRLKSYLLPNKVIEDRNSEYLFLVLQLERVDVAIVVVPLFRYQGNPIADGVVLISKESLPISEFHQSS